MLIGSTFDADWFNFWVDWINLSGLIGSTFGLMGSTFGLIGSTFGVIASTFGVNPHAQQSTHPPFAPYLYSVSNGQWTVPDDSPACVHPYQHVDWVGGKSDAGGPHQFLGRDPPVGSPSPRCYWPGQAPENRHHPLIIAYMF
jgi:hypothetical protein